MRTKIIPVSILAEGTMENVQSDVTDSAGTKTADVCSVGAPRTQTSEYRMSVPLPQTALEFVLRITPTITFTPTVMVTSSPTHTVVSMPAQIIASGSHRQFAILDDHHASSTFRKHLGQCTK